MNELKSTEICSHMHGWSWEHDGIPHYIPYNFCPYCGTDLNTDKKQPEIIKGPISTGIPEQPKTTNGEE